MIRKPKNGITTGGWSSGGNVSSPISRDVQLPEAMKLPSSGFRSRKGAFVLLVGNCEQHLARRLLRLPARLDRRELRRLMLEYVEARQVAEEELDRDQHRDQSEAPVQHHARLGAMDAAQHVPGAGGRHAHAGRQECSEQHVRPADHHHWPEHDLAPVRGDDPAVDDRVAERHLHPAVVGEDPERREHRPERDHAAGEEIEARRHAVAPEQHDAEEGRLQHEGGEAS